MNLFAPPQIISTEVFSEVPTQFRKQKQMTNWARANRPGVELASFLEGPSFDRAGNLYIVDIPYGRIFRISPQGNWDLVTEYNGEPNGLKFHRDGRAFICDYRNGLMQLDVASGKVTPLLERNQSESFRGLNDLIFASNGDVYFTDQGQTGMHDPSGRVYRYCADGKLTCLLNNVPSPNGLVLNTAQNVLLVAATRSNSIWRVPLTPDGGVTKVGIFAYMSGGTGPDGMAMDAAGNVCVAHVGMGCVWMFSPKGEPLYRIQSCRGDAVTNMAFGGADGKSLFITESETGTILRASMPNPGARMFSHL
jgi:gluconolactonase